MIKLPAYKDKFSFIYIDVNDKLKPIFESYTENANTLLNYLPIDNIVKNSISYEIAGTLYKLQKDDELKITLDKGKFTFWIESLTSIAAVITKNDLLKLLENNRTNLLIVKNEYKRLMVNKAIEAATFDAEILLGEGYDLKLESTEVKAFLDKMYSHLQQQYFSLLLNTVDELIASRKIDLNQAILKPNLNTKEKLIWLNTSVYEKMTDIELKYHKTDFESAKKKLNSNIQLLTETITFSKCRAEVKGIVRKQLERKNLKLIE